MTMVQDLAAALAASASGITPAIAGSVAAGAATSGGAPVVGSDQLTGSEMDREWGWTAPPALGGGGAGRAGRGSSLEAIEEALLAQNTGGWGDPQGGWWDRMQDRVYNFGGDVAGWGGWNEVGDAVGWAGDQYGRGKEAVTDAWGNIIEGDLSEAVGDLAGGAWDVGWDVAKDVGLPVLGYLGQEAGQIAGDIGSNIYSNWGLEDLLQAAGGVAQDVGGFVQDLPGHGLDALNYLGGYALDQGENLAK